MTSIERELYLETMELMITAKELDVLRIQNGKPSLRQLKQIHAERHDEQVAEIKANQSKTPEIKDAYSGHEWLKERELFEALSDRGQRKIKEHASNSKCHPYEWIAKHERPVKRIIEKEEIETVRQALSQANVNGYGG